MKRNKTSIKVKKIDFDKKKKMILQNKMNSKRLCRRSCTFCEMCAQHYCRYTAALLQLQNNNLAGQK